MSWKKRKKYYALFAEDGFGIYENWEDVPKNEALYIRPGRSKPGLVYFHKSAVDLIPEMQWAKESIKCDADIRSMCSRGFAQEFFKNNR